jgi:hypothetical protein
MNYRLNCPKQKRKAIDAKGLKSGIGVRGRMYKLVRE